MFFQEAAGRTDFSAVEAGPRAIPVQHGAEQGRACSAPNRCSSSSADWVTRPGPWSRIGPAKFFDETKRSMGVESMGHCLDQHSMLQGAGTAVMSPEAGGTGSLFIGLSHSFYAGPGSLFLSKLGWHVGSKTLMVSTYVHILGGMQVLTKTTDLTLWINHIVIVTEKVIKCFLQNIPDFLGNKPKCFSCLILHRNLY